MNGPAPLRVIDLTDELAHQAARLLVGIGADVVRPVLSADGSPCDPAALHWHAGKRVVEAADDRELAHLVRRLAIGADVVLESGPLRTLRTPTWRQEDPTVWSSLVQVIVTPFGLTGPRRDWLADDLVATASGGMAWLGGHPGQPPQPPPRDQAGQLAGSHAAIGALMGVIARRRTGRGQMVDISVQEAVAATLETGSIAWIHGQHVPARSSGFYGHVAHRVFASADGHVAGGYSGSDRMWDDLLAWMVEEGEAEDLTAACWQDPVTRWEGRSHVDGVVARFAVRRTSAEIAAQGLGRALPWAEVASPARLLENPQLRDRRYFVDIGEGIEHTPDVGFPFESPGLPRPVRLTPPALASVDLAWHDRRSGAGEPATNTRRARPAPGRSAALDGLRVLDLTWVLAGPYATRTLAEHGADIIKVESKHRQDPTRFSPGMRLRPGADHDESGYFLNFNRGKRSLALNLRSPEGQQTLRDLVPEVDVVVENFSPGVLEKWGLGYGALRKLNPDIILVSMSGVGHTGPWRNAVTFADTLAAMSGLTFETGDPEGPPLGLTFGLGDMVAANAAVLATLDLVLRGDGGHVDLSQLEAMASHIGTAVVDAPERGVPWTQDASGVFPTAGDDRWIAIGACQPARLFAALDAAPEPGGDLAQAIAQVTSRYEAEILAARLQARGVPAYPVRDGRDLVERDQQLAARGFYVALEHPRVGAVDHEGVVIRMADTPGGLWSPAPLLGQHTAELLAELLGLGPSELTDLTSKGVLE